MTIGTSEVVVTVPSDHAPVEVAPRACATALAVSRRIVLHPVFQSKLRCVVALVVLSVGLSMAIGGLESTVQLSHGPLCADLKACVLTGRNCNDPFEERADEACECDDASASGDPSCAAVEGCVGCSTADDLRALL